MAGFPVRERKALERAGVLVKAPDAEEIPDPRFPSSGRLVGVRPTSRGFEAVALDGDEYFAPIRLSDSDVRQCSVSVPKLVELIRQQNGIEGDGETPDTGMIPVGQKTIDGFGPIEIYLSLPNSDLRHLAAACLSLIKPAGVRKVVVLLPCAVRLPVQERQLLDGKGIMLIALAPLADGGSLVIDWESHVLAPVEDRPDGVYPPRTVVVRGREFKCELNKNQMAFMQIALQNDEVELGQIIHRGQDALWNETFSDTRATRNKVTQFLSRLNKKLASARPSFPFFFSLPRGRRSIVRTTDSDAA